MQVAFSWGAACSHDAGELAEWTQWTQRLHSPCTNRCFFPRLLLEVAQHSCVWSLSTLIELEAEAASPDIVLLHRRTQRKIWHIVTCCKNVLLLMISYLCFEINLAMHLASCKHGHLVVHSLFYSGCVLPLLSSFCMCRQACLSQELLGTRVAQHATSSWAQRVT